MFSFLKKLLLLVVALWVALAIYDTLLPPFSTLMAARVLTLRHVERQYEPLERISPNLVRAVIAAEDGQFCTNHGVDWKAMRAATQDVIEDEAVSHGGSTITMQTAKNLFLWMGYSYLRKPIEVPMALLLNMVWSKRLIMENYLNVAEFGRGIFGAEAASRHYFHHSAATLSVREAALLAAVLPSPNRHSPVRPTPFVSRYAERIAARINTVTSSCAR